MRHVDGVRHDVGEDSVAGFFQQVPPAQNTEPVPPVHREEATPVVSEVSEAPVVDQLLEILNEWSPSIVETDPGDDPSPAGRLLDRRGHVRCLADRFLAEDGLSGRSRGNGDLPMQLVGGS